MRLTDLIVYATLVVFILYVTRINNFWGTGRGSKKLKSDVKKEKSQETQKMVWRWVLSRLEWFSYNIGKPLNDFQKGEYEYKIERLNMYIKLIRRFIKPTELVGLFRFIQLLSSFIALVGVVYTGNIAFLIFLFGLVVGYMFDMYALSKISEEDEKLERDFPEFFLVLYSRLTQGYRVRLAPTLTEYLQSIETDTHGDMSKDVIRKFVMDLRRNIEIYGDDSLAVMKIRDKYRSVMVVNFCNLAVQALRGVDNKDKLLSFKMELTNRRIEQMTERAEKLVRKGQIAVYSVYLILAQFIVISWVAKMSLTGGIFRIFGM